MKLNLTNVITISILISLCHLVEEKVFNIFWNLSKESKGTYRCGGVIPRNMLANEAVNASRMIDMHISVYEAKCATTHSHISVYGRHAVRSRDIGARISNWIIYYLLTQYIFLHFLASRDAGLWTRAKTYPPLAAPFNCPHTINSLVFFRIGQLIYIFMSRAHMHCRIILRGKNALFLIAYYDCLFLIAFTTISSPYVFNRPTLLSQVRTNGPTTNHSRFSTRKRSFRRKPINPIGRISEALCAHYGKPWHAYIRTLKLFRDPARHRREENENTGRIAEQREKR